MTRKAWIVAVLTDKAESGDLAGMQLPGPAPAHSGTKQKTVRTKPLEPRNKKATRRANVRVQRRPGIIPERRTCCQFDWIARNQTETRGTSHSTLLELAGAWPNTSSLSLESA